MQQEPGNIEKISAPLMVTVLMAAYNAESFLARSIDSILAQTFHDFEFLIVDDGSQDQTPALLADYARKDRRIRVLRNERNLGLTASLNRGLREAKGVYVARIDADDAARPERLALQVAFMEQHREIGICGGQIVKHTGGKAHRVRIALSHGEIHATLLFHSCFVHPTVLIRRDCLGPNGFMYDERYNKAEDYELWDRMIGPVRAGNLPQVLLDYYCHPRQISGSDYQVVTPLRNSIRHRIVKRLLPEADERQLALHDLISYPFGAFALDVLPRADRWLQQLLAANQTARIYDPHAMESVFARKWGIVCAQAAYLGLPVFRIFWKSPLSRPIRGSAESLKLLAKCAIRKKYG
jgi:glycosyltransferase involved in cell wall biosynthesis